MGPPFELTQPGMDPNIALLSHRIGVEDSSPPSTIVVPSMATVDGDSAYRPSATTKRFCQSSAPVMLRPPRGDIPLVSQKASVKVNHWSAHFLYPMSPSLCGSPRRGAPSGK